MSQPYSPLVVCTAHVSPIIAMINLYMTDDWPDINHGHLSFNPYDPPWPTLEFQASPHLSSWRNIWRPCGSTGHTSPGSNCSQPHGFHWAGADQRVPQDVPAMAILGRITIMLCYSLRLGSFFGNNENSEFLCGTLEQWTWISIVDDNLYECLQLCFGFSSKKC